MKTRKRLNVRFVACVLAAIAVFGIAVHLVHGYQVKRNASTLLDRADKAREDKDAVKEMEYLARYLGFRPKDNDALARYGEVLDEQAKKTKSIKTQVQAFFTLETVLRRAPERRDLRRRQIDIAMAIGKFGDALEHFKFLEPLDAELARLKGICQEVSGQYADAVKSYESAIRRAPNHIDNYLRVAALYRDRLNDPTKAEAKLNALVDANKDDFRAYLLRARYRLQNPAPLSNTPKKATPLELADADVKKASELAQHTPDKPDSDVAGIGLTKADIVLAEAEIRLAQGDPKLAREVLIEGLKAHPDNPRMYLKLIALEVREDKAEKALELVRQGLVKLPDNGDLLHTLADLLVQRGELKEAEETIVRLRQMDYAPALLDYLQARILFSKREWRAAEEILARVHSQLARLPGLEAQALLLLGECHEQLGNPDQALIVYQQARNLDPLSFAAHYRCATAFLALGRTSAALAEFRNILAGPKIPDGLYVVLARALIASNQRLPQKDRNFDEIRRVLDLAADKTPDAPELPVLQAEARLLEGKENLDDARRRIEKARDAHPDDVGLWIALAQLSGREESLRLLDRAQSRPKLADSVELRLARLNHLTLLPADAQTPEQRKKVEEEARARLAEMEKEATTLREADRLRLLNGLADAHLRLGDSAAAERLWRQVAEQQPNNLGVRLRLFDLASLTKDNAAMDRILADIHQIEGENGVYWRYAEAARLIEQARPGENEKLSESARRQLRQARQYLTDAATRRPTWPRIPALEAEIDELEGVFSKAIEKYQQALELGDRRPAIVRRTVQLLFEQQRFEEANQAVRKLLDQENVLLSAGLGKLVVENLLANGDPSQRDSKHALELALRSVSPQSKSYLDHLWLGRVLASLGKKDEAEESLRRACKLEETAPEAWVALVAFLADAGKKKEAKEAIEQARTKLPAKTADVALAACYETVGDLPKAEKHVSAALSAAPKNVRMLRNAADFFIRHGQSGKAKPHLRAILALDSKASSADTAWARRTLAAVLAVSTDHTRFEEALALIEKNLAENKNSTADEHARALLLATRLSKRKEAIRLFEDLNRRSSLSANERFTLVRLYLAEDNWPQAQLHMMTLLASPEGKNPTYQAYYARRLLQRDDVAAAQDQLDKLEKALPDAPLTREIKARVLQAKGKDAEAVAVVREYAQSKDADLAGAALLLETLAQKGDPKGIYAAEAEALYRKYAAQSDKPERFLTLAGFLGRKHAVAEALSCCEEALWNKAAPEMVAQVMTSVLRETPSEEQSRRVEKSLKDMLAKTPQSVPLLICLADLYDQRERFAEAEALYQQVLQKDENNLIALNNLAWLLAFKTPPREEALEVVTKAIKLVGPSPELLDTRGVIHMMLSQFDRGLEDLQQAIAQSPSPNRFFHLACALAAAKRRDAAREKWKEAQKHGFDDNRIHPLEKPLYQQLRASLMN